MSAHNRNYRKSFSLLFILIFAGPASAFDAWEIEEIFSNYDGSIQYIKLSTASENQQNLAGHEIRALDGSGAPLQNFLFPSSLSGSTANRSVLIGTSAFSELTQLAVDYQLPDGFLPLDGGTVQLPEIDSLTYQRTQLPRNGSQALRADGTISAAMPANFAGLTAAVDAPVLSEFDGVTSVLNMPVVDVPGMGAVNVTMHLSSADPIQFTLGDSYIYAAGAIAGPHAAVFQSSGVLYVPGAIVGNEIYEVNMSLISETPITFGSLVALSVTPRVPVVQPPVEPPTEPPVQPPADPQADSIAAGQSIFAQVCATCHGASGGGTAQAPSLASAATQPFASLRQFIHDNMPFGNPGACVDSAASSCATDVTNYIRSAFVAGSVTVGY